MKHPTVLLSNPVYGRVAIDTYIAPVIRKLWQLDINTHCCCEGLPATNWNLDNKRPASELLAQIGFPSLMSFRRFFKILGVKAASLKKERGWLFESTIHDPTEQDAALGKLLGEGNYYFAYFKSSDIMWIQEKLVGLTKTR